MDEDFDKFYVPYPSRDDPNFQSLLYAKPEIRALAPDAARVDDVYFNTQVLYGIIMEECGSVFLMSATGSGKSGNFARFESEMRRKYPGAIKDFYYVCGDSQQKDFQSQVTTIFSNEEDKARSEKGDAREATRRRRIIKEHFKLCTPYELAQEINNRSNSDLLRDYGNCAFFFDEIHLSKLDEKQDSRGNPRDRFKIYCAIWRLTHVCIDAYFTFASATPRTNLVSEFAYHFNLMPKTKQIRTPLAERVVKFVNQTNAAVRPTDWEIEVPEGDWVTVNLSIIDKLDVDYNHHITGYDCTGEPIGEDVVVTNNAAELEELFYSLAKVANGRIIYTRAPSTGVVQTYPDGKYDECSHRTLRHLNMSVYQSECYARMILQEQVSSDNIIENLRDHEDTMEVSKVSTKAKKIQTKKAGKKKADTGEDPKQSLYLRPKQASVIVYPPPAYISAVLKLKPGQARPDVLSANGARFQAGVGLAAMNQYITFKSHTVRRTVESYDTLGYARNLEAKGLLPTKEVHEMIVDDNFARFVQDNNNLYDISAKFFYIVAYVEDPTTSVAYVFDEYYNNNCLGLAAILMSRPLPRDISFWVGTNVRWTQFSVNSAEDWLDTDTGKIKINKAPRFLLYTSETDPKILEQGLELERHPDNVNGHYLKIIIATELGSTGININHGTAAFFNISRFTPTGMEQAKSRIFRPTSHTELIKQRDTLHPELAGTPFEVQLSYFVARVAQEVIDYHGKDIPVIDALLYRVIYEKDFKFAKLDRMCRMIALDGPINVERNIRPTDMPGSREMEYEMTPYTFPLFDPNLPEDLSTFSRYYNTKSFDMIRTRLVEIFTEVSSLPVKVVLDSISGQDGFPVREINNCIRVLIETTQVLIVDRYGYSQYLAESRGVLYLTRDPFTNYDMTLDIYSAQATYYQAITLDEYATQEPDIDIEIAVLNSDDYGKYENVNYWFANLDAYKKVRLFEVAAVTEASWAEKVRRACQMLYFFDEATNVTVHEIELLYSKTTNYNAVDGLLRPNGKLRIYVDGEWRYANEREREYYAKIIIDRMEARLQEYYATYADIGVIAIIVRPNRVHIREFAYVKGAYYGREGTKCTGLKVYSIIGMLYHAMTYAPSTLRLSESTVDNYKAEISNAFPRISRNSIEQLALDHGKLKFYYDRVINGFQEKIKKSSLCAELCQALYTRGAVFTLIGDAALTIRYAGSSA